MHMVEISHKSKAVAANRMEPLDSLDFFPTPPFATRNFLDNILFRFDHDGTRYYRDALGGEATAPLTAYDPCSGAGHMVTPLSEYFDQAVGTDIHDYGQGFGIHDFLCDQIALIGGDWVVMNPPFNRLHEFVDRALKVANTGIAMFSRVGFLESISRYESFFSRGLQPTLIAYLPERLPIFRGIYNPDGGNRPYQFIWSVWKFDTTPDGKRTLRAPQPPVWLPTGQRKYIKQEDLLIGTKSPG